MKTLCLVRISLLAISALSFSGGCGSASKPPAAAPAPARTGTPPGSPSAAPATGQVAPGQVSTAPPTVDVSKTEPAITVSAVEFSQLCVKDFADAKGKYHGKVIQLQGDVNQSGRYAEPPSSVVTGEFLDLKTAYGSMRCEFSDRSLWKKAAKGSTVTIKGKWRAPKESPASPNGGAGNLKECVLVEASASPRIVTTVQQLLEDTGAGREAFSEKYDFKDLLVEGEVSGYASVRGLPGEYPVFKTSSPQQIVFVPMRWAGTKIDPTQLKAQFPIGKKVAIIGQFNSAIDPNAKDILFLEGDQVELQTP